MKILIIELTSFNLQSKIYVQVSIIMDYKNYIKLFEKL